MVDRLSLPVAMIRIATPVPTGWLRNDHRQTMEITVADFSRAIVLPGDGRVLV